MHGIDVATLFLLRAELYKHRGQNARDFSAYINRIVCALLSCHVVAVVIALIYYRIEVKTCACETVEVSDYAIILNWPIDMSRQCR